MTASTRPLPVQPTTPASSFVRRRELPALALPRAREDRRAGALLSVVLHVLVVMLLATPFAVHHAIVEQQEGAGGPGPAGGGGGGHGGTGGVPDQHEQLQFVQVQPERAQVTPQPQPEIVPPTPVPPPEPIKLPTPEPKLEAKLEVAVAAKLPDVAALPGTGGGSGHDGTNGSGPGTGGGIGSGSGTGRGSGSGPGTGGGMQENFPPTATVVFIPPMPVPDKVRGSHVVAEFDVDSSGKVLSYDFTPTRDGGYNKRLGEAFRGFRFKPGTRPDGRPLRMKTQIHVDLP